MKKPKLKTVSAAGGIVTRVNNQTNRLEVLLVLSKSYGGYWGFAKGHVEPNETLLKTAIREVKEETGLDVVVKLKNKSWTTTYTPFPNTKKSVTYFWFEPKNPQARLVCQPEEIEKLVWVDFQMLKLFLTYETDKIVFDQFIKDIKK